MELSRVRVTTGKVTVNVWRKSRGKSILVQSSFPGFEISGFDCTIHFVLHDSCIYMYITKRFLTPF